jgi:anti-sigma factor RsiW
MKQRVVMNEDLQLKLQAYLDGELPSGEARTVAELLARDSAARDLLAELTYTRDAIVSHEADIKVPESREFYWSKIRRQIEREEQVAPAIKTISLAERFRRMLVPAGAVAAVCIAVMLTLPRTNGVGDSYTDAGDAVALTYHNYDSGTTLVWLDFTEENDLSEPESDDTLDL